AATLPRWHGPDERDVEAFLGFARALRVDGGRAVREELLGLLTRLEPSAHWALLHGDPCPGNDLHTAQGVRFVDFEQAAIGNGLVELAYLHIGFPTCWSSMTFVPELLSRADSAYRATWKAHTGMPVEGLLADACLGWLIRGDALVEAAHRGQGDQL